MNALTPLRGIAALTVLIFHITGGRFHGYLAVDLFFILSGFVLMHAYGRIALTWPAIMGFLRNRLARIYPVHLVVLVALLPAYGLTSQFSAGGLVSSLLLMQGPWHVMCWNFFSWSISAEWHAYLVFPFLAVAINRRTNRGLMVLLAVCALMVALAFQLHGPGNITNGPEILRLVLPEFAAGMILYRLYRTAALPAWLATDAAFIATVGALVGCGIEGLPDSLCVMLLPVLLLSAARPGSLAARILAIRPLPYLGEISYSLYMVQIIPQIIIEVLLPPLAPALQDVIFIVGSFALAIPMSRFVEYPARAWLKEPRGPRAPFRLAASHPRDRVETQRDATREPMLAFGGQRMELPPVRVP